jgi:DNA-binding NtrC family response regulator
MKSERALLLDVNAAGKASKVCDALAPILAPSFTVDVLVQAKQKVTEYFGDFSATLDKLIIPVLIFIAFSSGMLKETKMLLESVKGWASGVPIILINESRDPTDVLELLKAGAADFITTPLRASDVLPRAWRLVEHAARQKSEGDASGRQPVTKQLIGQSVCFLAHVMRIPLIARCDANVFIAGETGTGKELYARAIHYSSPRVARPFMPVNCGAIPVDLVENELFGHERGAFTSAFALQTGLVEEANGGTLFLDEIDCLPTLAQVKLLRFLQEREYRPLGSSKIRRANVRIIAASNLDPEEAVGNGKVRQDLFYRLNIISLALPPLRERLEDIPLLAHHFLEKYATEFGKPSASFSPDALPLLISHSWPGNVRELEHVIERALALCDGTVIKDSDLALSFSHPARPQESLQEAKAREIAQFEKNYVQGLLRACSGNITRAAHVAQKNRRAFWQLIKKHRIDVSRFKSNLS